uniref:Porin domain-containing protein n=1 Tax=Marinomonas sp. (strain MWYL1) TaxID=400668 RepID=A6W0D4_MARMS
MKAIKLASVFAVTAVAAAVSTATFAADAIITGEAGVEYTTYNGDSKAVKDLADGTDLGELELHVDTGIVYAELEVKTTGVDEGTKIGMEKLYVKQGAVSFGRFDGTVATGSFMGMDELFGGVDLKTAAGDTDNTGIRYKVTPELTIAVEATDSVKAVSAVADDPATAADESVAAVEAKKSEIGFAASYVMDFGAFKAGLSGGVVGDANAVNVGVQTVAGPATLSLNYGVGEKGTKTATTTTTDVEQVTASVALAATDALTLTLEYSQDLESTGKPDGTYFIAEYVAGDLTYYVKNYAGDLAARSDTNGAEQTTVGVKVFF